MNKPQKSEQPGSDDAVLGDQVSPPTESVVIGGLEGVKQRYNSDSVDSKVAALGEALKYGDEGLNFVIGALQDSDGVVQMSALRLLHDRKEPHVVQALEKHLNCVSKVGIDYKPLQSLLFTGEWERADKETCTILLKIAQREEYWLCEEDINNLPCEDLGTIDRLWRKYSGNHFGFSIQFQILTNCESINDFGSQVGWIEINISKSWTYKYDFRKNPDTPSNLSAPPGHLPTTFSLGGGKEIESYYRGDTESTMGFYQPAGSEYRWTYDSFFGKLMVRHFLEKFNKCENTSNK